MKSTVLPLFLSLSAVAAFSACGKSAMSGQNKQLSPEEVEAQRRRNEDATLGAQSEDRFITNGSPGKADVVWVIDNSSSMSEEAAIVRSNFSRFMTSLGQTTDLRVALLSDTQSTQASRYNTGVTLPAATGGILTKQVAPYVNSNVDPSFVRSTNPLALAAAASCSSARTSVLGSEQSVSGQICGLPVLQQSRSMATAPGSSQSSIMIQYEGIPQTAAAAGALQGFFRPDAKRMYVFVTDDNALGVTEQNFLQMVKSELPALDATVFGFIGMQSQPGCGISARGTSYETLASQTGGRTFDICAPNWDANFEALRQGISNVANAFQLSRPNVTQVIQVSVDGRVLAPNEFSQVSGRVTFAPGVLTRSGQQVLVRYRAR